MQKQTTHSFWLITHLILGLIIMFLTFQMILINKYKTHIYNNVFFQNTNVSGYQRTDFNKLFNKMLDKEKKFNISINSSHYNLSLNEIDFTIDEERGWNSLYSAKRSFPENIFPALYSFKKVVVFPQISLNQEIALAKLDEIVIQTSSKVIPEKITLSDKDIVVIPGKDGYDIDKNELLKSIKEKLVKGENKIEISPEIVSSSIPENLKNKLISSANGLVGKKISVTKDGEENYELNDATLIETLNDNEKNNFKYLNEIIDRIEKTFNKPSKDSVFIFDNGKVSEFIPSEDGITVDSEQLKKSIIEKRDVLSSSSSKEENISLPYKKTAPRITTESINNLGIKERIGTGTSTFKGSIPSRIHNIGLASSKFNGVLIAPGEVLSFNKTLGDVSKVTGYEPAYIIRDNQTILGDGGGVCQVSTTLFRGALNTGLPILERKSHSYRVGYYEQDSPPGLDATVFDPSVDLKIKNDFENYILIQTIFDKNNFKLTFSLYGTKDNRVSTISKPVITSSSPPPEDLYIDDPTLKIGVVRQIDYKAWGAKVYFNYMIEKNGETTFEKTFYSNYQPWQAKFLRGTGV